MKKKVLLSSLLTIALCLSIVAGSTYALFTSESAVNIAVTSGTVKVTATIDETTLATSSMDVAMQDGKFENGGFANVDGAELSLVNMTPGDAVSFKINILNESNVRIQYKLSWIVSGELASGLVATVDGTPVTTNSGSWLEWAPSDNADEMQKSMDVSISLPVTAGNDYQEKSARIAFRLEAVQFNGTDLYTTSVDSEQELRDALVLGGTVTLTDDITVADALTVEEGVSVVLDMNGKTISGAAASTFALRSTPLAAPFTFMNNGNLTIAGEGNLVTNMKNAGKLTVESGSFTAVNDACIENLAGENGSIVINGGSFQSNLTVADDANGRQFYALRNCSGSLMINDATVENSVGAIWIEGGKLTVNGGSFTQLVEDLTLSRHIVRAASCIVEINGGSFTHGANSGSALYAAGGAQITVDGGEFDTQSTSYMIDSAGNASFVLNGGTYTADCIRFNGGSTAIITGGEFNIADAIATSNNLSVSGGSFVNDPTSYVDSDAYTITKDEATGKYEVSVILNDVVVGDVILSGIKKDNAGAYYISTGEGLANLNVNWKNLANKSTVINLTDDIDFTGYTWAPVDSHADTENQLKEINGNGYTISNLTIGGQAMFKRFAGSGNVVIKDIVFDGAVVNSTALNSSILTVQTYQNVLLDNVDVKNSSITGAYKVAPLIATVYNESSSTVTLTVKDCDVSNTVVKATMYDFCTAGLVSFVYASDNDKVEFENCTVTGVKLVAPDDSYKAHAFVYTTGSDSLYNEADGVTVSGCTFEVAQ